MTLIKNSSLIKAEQTKWDLLKDVFAERARDEEYMNFRNPWFNMMYNYLIAVLVILLAVSLIWWSGNVNKMHREEQARAADEKARQEELMRSAEEAAEAEAQRQKEIEDMIDRWVEAGAKMLYGIRNFVEKYNYSEKDLETYLRCPWNRYLSNNRLTDLEVIIFKEDQFLACYRTSPALTKDKDFCRELFTRWYYEEGLPCDPSYVYAELVPEGIFLTKTYGASPYERRYHAE